MPKISVKHPLKLHESINFESIVSLILLSNNCTFKGVGFLKPMSHTISVESLGLPQARNIPIGHQLIEVTGCSGKHLRNIEVDLF